MPLGKNTRLASTSAGCVHTEVTVPVILPDIIRKKAWNNVLQCLQKGF